VSKGRVDVALCDCRAATPVGPKLTALADDSYPLFAAAERDHGIGDRRIRTQARENDLDEPPNGGLGRQAAGCRDGVEAVVGKFVRRDILSYGARLGSLFQKIPHKASEVIMRTGEVVAMVDERGEFGPVVLVANHRVGLEDGLESLVRVTVSVTELGKLPEMVSDLPFMPSEQN
jgi:hypothetical protein